MSNRNADQRMYVVVFNDGSEHVEYANLSRDDYRNFCATVVRNKGLVTHRNNPQYVNVGLYIVAAQKGAVQRSLIGTYDIMPNFMSMTFDEYQVELDDIINELPEEFRRFVSSYAYEEGHSSGFESVLNIARDITDRLAEPIANFRNRLVGHK